MKSCTAASVQKQSCSLREADHRARAFAKAREWRHKPKLRDDDPFAVTQPHLVSWWPAYLGFEQAKHPPGILKYTAGPALTQPAVSRGEQPGSGEREEGPGGRAASLDKPVSSSGLRWLSDWQHSRNVNLLESFFSVTACMKNTVSEQRIPKCHQAKLSRKKSWQMQRLNRVTYGHHVLFL